MSESYYDRASITHLDGTRIFQSPEDRRNEDAVARVLEAHWRCKLHHFGALSPIDWYATRDDRIVGVAELKSPDRVAGRFAWLSVRKWLALNLAQAGLGVPARFVVKFTDATFWIALNKIDASQVVIAGRTDRKQSDSTIEPIIKVSVALMRRLTPLN